jgi:hypothetical protein
VRRRVLLVRESADGIWVRLVALVACLVTAGVLSAATLTAPRRVGASFEFSIIGASNAIYSIEASRDLHDWTPVTTNRELGEVRLISMPSTPPPKYRFAAGA